MPVLVQIFETEPKPLLQKIAVSAQTLILISEVIISYHNFNFKSYKIDIMITSLIDRNYDVMDRSYDVITNFQNNFYFKETWKSQFC